MAWFVEAISQQGHERLSWWWWWWWWWWWHLFNEHFKINPSLTPISETESPYGRPIGTLHISHRCSRPTTHIYLLICAKPLQKRGNNVFFLIYKVVVRNTEAAIPWDIVWVLSPSILVVAILRGRGWWSSCINQRKCVFTWLIWPNILSTLHLDSSGAKSMISWLVPLALLTRIHQWLSTWFFCGQDWSVFISDNPFDLSVISSGHDQ